MTFDAHKNLAYSTVATAPSPATSGTSLTVAAGDASKFPAAPFNATVWPSGVPQTTANAEIVRVTAIATDTFTITRAQESSSARSIVVGDQIEAGITKKTLTDIENDARWTDSRAPSGTAGGDLGGTYPNPTVDGFTASTSYTPTLTQSSAVAKTVDWAHYIRLGKTVIVWIWLTPSATGSATHDVLVSLPVTAVSGGLYVGSGGFYDSSAGINYPLIVYLTDTTTFQLYRSDTGASGGAIGNDPNVALGSGDAIQFFAIYEAA